MVKIRAIRLVFVTLIALQFAGCSIFGETGLKKKEAALKQELYGMRLAIDQYTQDKNKAPQDLTDLVSAGYFKSIPEDPFTKSSATWQVAQEDVLEATDKKHPGITDVHSGSNAISSEGTPYSSW
jgi:general secretion pathway protein G